MIDQSAAAPDATRRNSCSFLSARGCGAFAAQMLDVAMGWHVYAATGSAMSLGFIGLAQFLPLVALIYWSGHAADRFDRRKVSAFAALGQAAASLAIFALASFDAPVWLIYPALFALGTARAFSGPANSSLLPEIVDKSMFSRAVAMSTIGVPGRHHRRTRGRRLALRPGRLSRIRVLRRVRGGRRACDAGDPLARRCAERNEVDEAEKSALAGLRYIWSNKVVFGAISLDLFAVLFGGATALLPIYCRDILHVGPAGLGLLRSGPAMGAILVGLALAVARCGAASARKCSPASPAMARPPSCSRFRPIFSCRWRPWRRSAPATW